MNVTFTSMPCDSMTVACANISSLNKSWIFHSSAQELGVYGQRSCNAICYSKGRTFYSLDASRHCRCYNKLLVDPANVSELSCKPTCDLFWSNQHCGNIYPVRLVVTLKGLRPFSIHEVVTITALSWSHIVHLYEWDFGDGSPPVREQWAHHKYGLPGRYTVTLQVTAGTEKVKRKANVTILLVPGDHAQLECPASGRLGQHLHFWVDVEQGNNLEAQWSFRRSNGSWIYANAFCPAGGWIFHENGHCYWPVLKHLTWEEARATCRQTPLADLTSVDGENEQNFLMSHLNRSSMSAWLGLSTIETPGTMCWVTGHSADEFGAWSSGNPEWDPQHGGCVQFDATNRGAWRVAPCTQPAPFICEAQPSMFLGDAFYFLVGTVAFSGAYKVRNLTRLQKLPTAGGDVELMLFPGLWFSHAGKLTELSLAVQHRDNTVAVRVQLYRPYCTGNTHLVAPGCDRSPSPFATCVPQLQCNGTGMCNTSFQWCNLKGICLPVGEPCSTYDPWSDYVPPRYNGTRPAYGLVGEVLLCLPAGPPFLVNVPLAGAHGIKVFPDDVLGLQHNTKPGSLLNCWSNGTSLRWRQSYLHRVISNWSLSSLKQGSSPEDDNGWTWVDGHVCDIRALYSARKRLLSSASTEHAPTPGLYTFSVSLGNPAGRILSHCHLTLHSAIDGLTVIHPSKNDSTKNTLTVATGRNITVLAKITAGSGALATWSFHRDGIERRLSFQASCPTTLLDDHTWIDACARETEDTWFSIFTFKLSSLGSLTLSIIASNNISQQVTSVVIHGQDAIEGLAIMDTRQTRYVVGMRLELKAKVSAGSSVRYSWWRDGVLLATGHAFNMELESKGNITLKVQNVQLPSPHLNVLFAHVPPGDGKECSEINITVNVSDGHGKLTKTTGISVQVPIGIVNIHGPSNAVMVGKPEVFTAVVIPSSSPVLYTWNFNTGIHREVNVTSQSVEYIFPSPGQYTVSVLAQNGISSAEAGVSVLVSEGICGLVLDYAGPDELGTPSYLSATVQRGEPVNWTFIMGDGWVYANRSSSKVAHIYETEGNYTVTVVTVNPVSSQNTSQIVHVFELRVIGISLVECVPTKHTISLHVKTSGDARQLVYLWHFNDGTSPVSVHGSPLIEHLFTTGGNFSSTLKVSSNYSDVFFSFLVCVEEMINYILLTPRSTVAAVAVDVEFVVQAYPPASETQQYKYVWDFGVERPRSCLGPKASYSYNDSGTFMVVVSVSNNLDRKNASVPVFIQDKVEMLDLSIANCSATQLSINKSCLFMAKASGTDVAYAWDFGDGSEVMQSQDVHYNFSLSGVFTINCSAANAVSSAWTILEVTVLAHLTNLEISANVLIAEVNVAVTFYASLPNKESASYQWAMCEGCPFLPGSAIYTHTFLLSETYAVTCLADNAISTAKAKMNLTVAEKIAGLQLKIFNLTDHRYCETAIPLTASASVAKGSNVEYIWTVFQEFSVLEVLEGPEVNIYLRESGSYIIVVLARNGLGEAFTNKSVEALDRVDEINLVISPDPITLGKNVTFQAKHSSGTDVVYTWQVAKHEVPIETSLPTFMHVYAMPREEVASVVASNILGNVSDAKNVTIYEAVEGLQIVTLSFVATGNYTKLQGCVKHGSSIMWVWVIPTFPGNQLYYEKEIFHRFASAAVYRVMLNASNPVSTQMDVCDIIVQDEVRGFQLLADKLVAEPQEEVTFVMTVAGGSSVEYTIYLSEFTTVKVSGTNYTHRFSQVGIHDVLAVASNMVSSDTNATSVKVLRKIVGLEIFNCCSEVLQSGTAKEFIALVAAGSNVTFCWTFTFPGHLAKVLEGSSVVFTTETHGNLTIILNASNILGHVQINELLIVQQDISGASLDCNVTSPAFVGESIKFQVLLQSGSDIQYDWYFGDNSTMIAQSLPFAVHTYTAVGDYKVLVQICNALSCATEEMLLSVTLGGCRAPIVQFVAPRSYVPTALPSVFEALVDFGGCEARYHATYLWQVWEAPNCIGMNAATLWSLPVSVDVRRPQLWLPARALPVGDICLAFTSALKDTLLIQTLYLNVTVKASQLVAVIAGGSYRTLGLHEPLQLDARKSYDPDVSSAKTPSLSGMQFIWTTSVKLHKTCFDWSLNSSLVVLSVRCLKPSSHYNFSLTVSKDGKESSGTFQMVTVANASVPSVLVECASCETLGSFVTGRSHHVTLLGSCAGCAAQYFNQVVYSWTAWSEDGKPFPLNITTTSTGASGAALVVRKGVLSNGPSYIFTLTVSGLGVEPGSSSLVLPPNEPPGGGFCELHRPLSLTVLESPIGYACHGWTDPENPGVPLVYTLLLRSCTGLETVGCEEQLLYCGINSEASGFAPLTSGQQFLAVIVEDALGARTLALEEGIFVALPKKLQENAELLTTWLQQKSERVFQALVQRGDPQHITSYGSALLSILNVDSQGQESKITADIQFAIRRNITLVLTSLRASTLTDVWQTATALSAASALPDKFSDLECQDESLSQAQRMVALVEAEAGVGEATPDNVASKLFTIIGQVLNANSQSSLDHNFSSCSYTTQVQTAVSTRAYTLANRLLRALMASRVLDEETLVFHVPALNAEARRVSPLSLLCAIARTNISVDSAMSGCHFSIPSAAVETIAIEMGFPSNQSSLVQTLLFFDVNPFPSGSRVDFPITTNVASLELYRPDGLPIEVLGLSLDAAISVTLSGMGDDDEQNFPLAMEVLDPGSTRRFAILTNNSDPAAGLFVQIKYSLLHDSLEELEGNAHIRVTFYKDQFATESQAFLTKVIMLKDVYGNDPHGHTTFLSPSLNDTTKPYYADIKNCDADVTINVSVLVYLVLCQYYDQESLQWRTEGMVPTMGTSPYQAVCLTQHLSVFGATLLHPHGAVIIVPPVLEARSLVVAITCAVLGILYVFSAMIAWKMDIIDVARVGFVPLCSPDGYYKYEVTVKTGWTLSAGTTAHVGICLYGQSCSGPRHLALPGAFQRNNLDIFHIASDTVIGSIWKIHIWHDNTGLHPSWFLQHVLVRDLGTNKMYFFLVDDWLSVDNSHTDGVVKKEVLAASLQELNAFRRLFPALVQHGLFAQHAWLSILERPARSRFTRLQRVSDCALLLAIPLCSSAMWYGGLALKNDSQHLNKEGLISSENVAVGVVAACLAFPVHILIAHIFKNSRTNIVMVEDEHEEAEMLEIDAYVNSSDGGVSIFDVTDSEDICEEKTIGNRLVKSKPSLEIVDTGFLPLSGQAVVPPAKAGIKRHRALLQLDPTIASQDEDLVEDMATCALQERQSMTEYVAKGEQDVFEEQDHGSEPGSHSSKLKFGSISSRDTAMADTRKKAPLPYGCIYAAHAFSLLLLVTCFFMAALYGLAFSPSVALMWLTSCAFSFLTSFFALEPLKVLGIALYQALLVRPLDPYVDRGLVEEPLGVPSQDTACKVRAPLGYGLLQAKVEASKLRSLHRLLKAGAVYLILLLLVLLLNHWDSEYRNNAAVIHAVARQGLLNAHNTSGHFADIKWAHELWQWLGDVLLMEIYDSPAAMQGMKIMLGTPRLRQIRSAPGPCTLHGDWTGMTSCVLLHEVEDTSPYKVGWSEVAANSSNSWAYTASTSRVWHYGTLRTYGCGGYIHPLSSTRSESHNILSELERNNWIDGWTRAVFVEYVQWVPAVRLHSVVTVFVEFPPVGGAVPQLNVWSFHLHRFDEPHISLVLMGCLLAFVPLLLVSEVMKAQRQGWNYVRSPWHVVQWLILFLSVCSPTIHLYRHVIALQLSTSFQMDSSSFINLYPIAFLESVEKDVTAFLLFLIILKMLRQIRFVRAYAVISNTFQQAYQKLLPAFITFLVLLLVFTQLEYLHTNKVPAYHSLGRTMMSLGSSLLACWFTSFADLDRGTAKMDAGMVAYISCAAVTLHWLFACLFAAILLSSHRVACNGVQGDADKPQAYEMMEFCIKRVKLTLGLIKPKEFRHSVKFEGMESLPSQSSYSRKSPLQTAPSLENIKGHYPNKTSGLSSLFARSTKSEPREAAHREGSPEVVGFLPRISQLALAAERMLMATEHFGQATISLAEHESQLLEFLQENREGDGITRKSHLGRALLPLPTQSEGLPMMANALETKSRYKRPPAAAMLNMLKKPKESTLSSERTFGVRSASLEQRVPVTQRQKQRAKLGKEMAQVERKQKE
uniref:polycystin-1 n=1 Tax=Myxine glutinosa TaxID=7769 RepID=UPI00358F4512